MNAQNQTHKNATEAIKIIEDFYTDLQKNPPYSDVMLIRGKHTRDALGDIRPGEAWTMQDALADAIAFFDSWNGIETTADYEILEEDGIFVKYTWREPVIIEYAPEITGWNREKFEIIEHNEE